jgi:hypothetical protein
MALLLGFLVILAVFTAFGILTFVAGADSRSGVDGESCMGRRRHVPETWW